MADRAVFSAARFFRPRGFFGRAVADDGGG
jgi:hypothetical protein